MLALLAPLHGTMLVPDIYIFIYISIFIVLFCSQDGLTSFLLVSAVNAMISLKITVLKDGEILMSVTAMNE